MAVTPSVTTTAMTVPIYTRINGNEIELGMCEIEIPIRIVVEPAPRREPIRHFADGCDGEHSPATNVACTHRPRKGEAGA